MRLSYVRREVRIKVNFLAYGCVSGCANTIGPLAEKAVLSASCPGVPLHRCPGPWSPQAGLFLDSPPFHRPAPLSCAEPCRLGRCRLVMILESRSVVPQGLFQCACVVPQESPWGFDRDCDESRGYLSRVNIVTRVSLLRGENGPFL